MRCLLPIDTGIPHLRAQRRNREHSPRQRQRLQAAKKTPRLRTYRRKAHRPIRTAQRHTPLPMKIGTGSHPQRHYAKNVSCNRNFHANIGFTDDTEKHTGIFLRFTIRSMPCADGHIGNLHTCPAQNRKGKDYPAICLARKKIFFYTIKNFPQIIQNTREIIENMSEIF